MNISVFYTQENLRNGRIASKNYFESTFKIIFQKKILQSGKVSNDNKENLKIASKAFFFKKILNQDLYCQENHKTFDLFINGGTY